MPLSSLYYFDVYGGNNRVQNAVKEQKFIAKLLAVLSCDFLVMMQHSLRPERLSVISSTIV